MYAFICKVYFAPIDFLFFLNVSISEIVITESIRKQQFTHTERKQQRKIFLHSYLKRLLKRFSFQNLCEYIFKYIAYKYNKIIKFICIFAFTVYCPGSRKFVINYEMRNLHTGFIKKNLLMLMFLTARFLSVSILFIFYYYVCWFLLLRVVLKYSTKYYFTLIMLIALYLIGTVFVQQNGSIRTEKYFVLF